MQQSIPGQQRIRGIVAFEIVHRIEEILPTRLALPPGKRAERIKPARDRRYESAFAAAIGRHRAKDRRFSLIGAISSAKPLNRAIGPPARFVEVVDVCLVVLVIEAGMKGCARSAALRDIANSPSYVK